METGLEELEAIGKTGIERRSAVTASAHRPGRRQSMDRLKRPFSPDYIDLPYGGRPPSADRKKKESATGRPRTLPDPRRPGRGPNDEPLPQREADRAPDHVHKEGQQKDEKPVVDDIVHEDVGLCADAGEYRRDGEYGRDGDAKGNREEDLDDAILQVRGEESRGNRCDHQENQEVPKGRLTCRRDRHVRIDRVERGVTRHEAKEGGQPQGPGDPTEEAAEIRQGMFPPAAR